nr:hypothetical protein [Marinicella sp. W31]MDC2877286.1 hypothetical protein [Marinicella sp. W31]
MFAIFATYPTNKQIESKFSVKNFTVWAAMEDKLTDFSKIFHLVELLSKHIFTPTDITVDFRFQEAPAAARAKMLEGPHPDWAQVTPDTVWGAPQSYFWFAGSVQIPEALEGQRICLGIEAMFGRVMGRSDPQCLVRVNGEIVQGLIITIAKSC